MYISTWVMEMNTNLKSHFQNNLSDFRFKNQDVQQPHEKGEKTTQRTGENTCKSQI